MRTHLKGDPQQVMFYEHTKFIVGPANAYLGFGGFLYTRLLLV